MLISQDIRDRHAARLFCAANIGRATNAQERDIISIAPRATISPRGFSAYWRHILAQHFRCCSATYYFTQDIFSPNAALMHGRLQAAAITNTITTLDISALRARQLSLLATFISHTRFMPFTLREAALIGAISFHLLLHTSASPAATLMSS